MNELKRNDLSMTILTQAIDKLKEEQGENFSLEKINLAELQRLTGLSRAKLRLLKQNGFQIQPHGNTGKTKKPSILDPYKDLVNRMLSQGISNSVVIFSRLKRLGYPGGQTIVKDYIRENRNLLPAKRQAVDPQGNRGRRYMTGPGEAYQMDWGFVNVLDSDGAESRVACFAMICHHCGQRYIEFFPNAKQENLFIGMVHAFLYMGIPRYVLTDNMKSVVIRRDSYGHPIWNSDYEAFMKTIGFETKLCKPRHPFTKGKVERLIRFVKENFIVGRCFSNLSDLNESALNWCYEQNSIFHKAIGGIPQLLHSEKCSNVVASITESLSVLEYLCPERRISFDGFIEYEGRRFGVPYSYTRKTVRVRRKQEILLIYSDDFSQLLTSHPVTWSRNDSYCENQFLPYSGPEEFPTMPVKVSLNHADVPKLESAGFEKFSFTFEEGEDE